MAIKILTLDGMKYLTSKIKGWVTDGFVAKVDGKGLSSNDYTDAEKTKLAGIATGANKTTVDSALSSSSTNPVQNKVVNSALAGKQATLTAGTNITIDGTTISAKDTTYGTATTSANGLMSKGDKSKLDGVATGAQVNKIETVKVNGTTLTVSSKAVNIDLSNYATKADVSAIPKYTTSVVDELPTSNISTSTIYLVPNEGSGTNAHDEYIYVDGAWELLGTTELDISGKQDKLTAGTNITISGTTISAKDTTYSVATTSANGLMSSSDKSKLDGIATGANKTVVDTALSSTSTNPVQNKVVNSALAGKLSTTGTAAKATADASGNVITDTYETKANAITGLSVSGKTVTYTKGDGTTGTITTQDTNTDTKNTAGSTDSSSKLFLIGATSQAANPQTYSHDTAYVGTDGKLYSGGKVVIASGDTATAASKAAQLTTARTIDGVSFNGTANITHYGTCSTDAGTAAKVVAITGFTLATGARAIVKFTVTNTVDNPTLNINSTGAKAIQYRGSAISKGYLAANRTYEFVYDGTNYQLVGDINTDANNVTAQNVSTSNNTYPVLLGYTANATANIGNKATLFGAGIKANPSTSTIVATTFDGTATKASKDASGNVIVDTYETKANAITGLSVSGRTITYTKGDGTTGTITTQDSNNDTKNTAGSTDSSSKLFIIGATSQAANPVTYSHDTAYVGTDGKLYSGGKVVIASGDTATAATKATQDGNGKVIADTYETKANAITGLSVSGKTITYTKGDGETGTITTQDTNTTYSVATTSANGLMSSTDKSKLDGIATGANKTTVDSALSSTSTNPVQNKVINTALAGKLSTSGTAAKATADASGNVIVDTYETKANAITGLSVSGKTITYTKGDGSTGTITTQDNNTDTKVTQTNSTGTSAYPILLKNGTGTGTVTNGVLFDDGVTIQPSTGTITATILDGKVHEDREDITGQTLDINTLNLSAGSPHIMRYIEKTSGGSSNITNIPVTGQPFILDVELIRWASTTDYVTMQRFVSVGAKANEYVRYDTSGTWSSWTKRVFTDNNTTYSVATSSANGLMSKEDKAKLDAVTASADAVSVTASLTSGTKVGTITVNGTGIDLYCHTNTDTKNTAGSTDSSSKLFLVGATSQAANPQTYSHDTAYVGTDGKLYSGGKVVIASGDTATAATKATQDGSGNVITSTYETKANAITGLSVSGRTITYTKGDGTTGTITTQDNNTDTKNTTGTSNKTGTKLFLAGATSQGTNPVTYSNSNVYIGTDNKLYSNGKVVIASGDTATAATKATQDGSGNVITDTYETKANAITGLSVSGKTVTYTKGDGTTGTITTQDTNTTYSNMTGATSSAAGTAGLVPAPAAGKQTSFLRGDGTWVVPTNTTYSVATSSANGLMSSTDKAKLDAVTASADAVSFSRSLSSGTKIGTITINGTATDLYCETNTDTNTTYSNATTSAAGLMSASDKSKLDAITASADSVSISRSLTSGTKIGTITINGIATDLYCQTNTDTNTTYSAGTGLTLDGTTFKHSNSVTAQTSYVGSATAVPRFKFDAQGHITGVTTATIYPPTTVGTAGQVWVSDGSGAGAWKTLVTISTSDPSGGSNGDLWFKYE